MLAADNNMLAASRASGIPEATLRNRVAVAKRRGLVSPNPEIPGYTVKSISTSENEEGEVTSRSIKQTKANGEGEPVPAFMDLKGLSRYEDGDGRVIGQWLKYSKSGVDPIEVAKHVAAAFDGMKIKLPRIDCPPTNCKDLLNVYPVADWHLGMMAWGDEAGENWDLKIASKALRKTASEVVMRSPVGDTGVVLGLGDLLHADNSLNQTSKSGNVLDVDGRYQKIVGAACGLMADVVMMALQKHKRVIVRILPGNHDEHACVAVAYFLAAFFRDEKRVTVDLDPAMYWVHKFGKNLLVGTHAHMIKPAKLQSFISSNYRELWGQCEFVRAFVGHLHHTAKIEDEHGGMIVEQITSPIPSDAWHHASGYMGGRAMTSYTFHAKDGLISQLRQGILK